MAMVFLSRGISSPAAIYFPHLASEVGAFLSLGFAGCSLGLVGAFYFYIYLITFLDRFFSRFIYLFYFCRTIFFLFLFLFPLCSRLPWFFTPKALYTGFAPSGFAHRKPVYKSFPLAGSAPLGSLMS